MIKSLMSLVLTVGMIIILTSCTGGYKEYDGFEKDREAVRNSDAAYLLDPGFEITEDNLRQVIHDLFTAPGMLYFRCIASGPENGRRTGDSDIKERLDRAFDDLGQIRSQREVISSNKETGKETLFSDVPADAWYAESLRENVEMGLLSGYGDGTFEPQHAIYWWTLAQVLYNFTEGYDLDWWTDFADETSVRIPWYQPVVKFASGFGLIPYRPDEAFALEWPTRFQVIQSFYQLGIRTEAIDSSQNRALDWALENKILIGDENGDLRLEDHISRAELSEVLQRVWPIFEGHRFITRLYFIDEQDVEYIFIRDGNNGNGITYTDRETIHDVVERLNRFRTDRAADGRAGGYNASLRLVMKQPGKLIEMNISAGGVSTGRIGYHALDQGLFTDDWIDVLCRRQ